MSEAMHLRRLEVAAFVSEIRALRISRMVTVLVLGAFVCAVGGPIYLASFVAPHLALYVALFVLAERRHADPSDAGLPRFVVEATVLRVALAAHACWCGLDLRAFHGLGTEGGFLILSSLMLSALQAQPSRISYLLGLAPPLLTLLFIGFVRPVADLGVGGAIVLFLTAMLTTAFRTRKAMLRGLAMRADLAAKNAQLAETVAAADLAEEVAGLGRWSLQIPDGEIVWSKGTHLIYGLDPSLKPSLAYAVECYHPEDRALVDAAVTQAMSSDGVIAFRHRLIRADGSLRHVAVKSKRVEGAGGRASLIGVIQDVTEQVAAAQAVEESEARFRSLAEAATDVTTRARLDGHTLFATLSSERVLGYTPAEMAGRRFHQEIHPDDYKPLMQRLSDLIAAGPRAEPITVRYRYRRKDGAWIWLEGAPRAIFDPASGEAIEIQDTVRDVTARAEMEADLVAAREAAEAGAQAKSDFLANMSHELRTPLNSIVGFAGLIVEAPELTGETRRYASLVAAASRSLVEIVNDVLDVATFESEGVRLEPAPVELDILLRTTADLLRGEAERKGLVLEVLTPAAESPVLVDATRLRQVVLNLLGNAIKFTESGQVTLSLSRDTRGAIKIAVRDTGVGIPTDRQRRIFDRFAQADPSTSRRFGGTGLGLAISQTLVEAMGGAIGLHSVEGAGSTFWFTLDLPEAPAPSRFMQHAAAVSDARLSGGLRVLLADDNPVNRELFAALMRATGVEITAVENGAEALRAVQEAEFDIIFMDVQMPVMDGLEATRAICDLPFAIPPIVALTANVLAAEVERCLAAGMVDHLPKPYAPGDVLKRIERWAKRPTQMYTQDDLSPSVIGDLEASIGPAALDSFLQRLAEQLHAMAALLSAPSDPVMLAAQAHSVRGLAGTLGFGEIARTYAALETACSTPGEEERIAGVTRAAHAATETSLATIARRHAAR